jgi:hypothetical protein
MRRDRWPGFRPVCFFALTLAVELALAQSAWDGRAQAGVTAWRPGSTAESVDPGRFIFCRVQYRSHTHRDTWSVDWPDSDRNFSERLSELTTIEVPRDEEGNALHTTVDLADREALFRFPLLYIVEVGYLTLTDDEARNLRDYLLRGGFLFVDDFWGEVEWNNWVGEIAKALPPESFPIVELPLEHEVFQIVFQMDELPQVPSIHYWVRTGRTDERPDAPHANYRGIYDDKGRLMVFIGHNTDLGDAWEREGENEAYFREFSAAKAYPLGINVVVYALTH